MAGTLGNEYSGIPDFENADFQAKPHGLPDSTADHPLGGLLGAGPQPGSLEASGAPPSLIMPVG